MKQTKKKVISLLLGLLCIFSLTACGSTKESTKNADVQSQAEQNAVGLAQTIVELSDSDIENYMISGDEFTENAMAAWDGAREELGALVEIKDSDLSTEYDETSKVYTVTVPAEFENADSNFVFEFDRTGSPSTLSVEVEYPKSVALQQAAMNTIMGLVVVFAVLIFLSFVISLLKYVPGFVESFGKKKKDGRRGEAGWGEAEWVEAWQGEWGQGETRLGEVRRGGAMRGMAYEAGRGEGKRVRVGSSTPEIKSL